MFELSRETMLWLSLLLGVLSGLFIGVRYLCPPAHLREKRLLELCKLFLIAILLPVFGILIAPLWLLF